MKITKFRIENYKSIIDSRDCYPAEMVTILAGKNEAGKSSILEALSDFNYGTPIRDSAIPITYENKKPKITVFFEVEKHVFEKLYNHKIISKHLKKSIINNFTDKTIINITKSYPATYTIPEEIFKPINDAIKSEIDEIRLTIQYKIPTANTGLMETILSTLYTISIQKNSLDIDKKISMLQQELDRLEASFPDSKKK